MCKTLKLKNMSNSEIKDAIDDIIDKSFEVIENVYKFQKESEPSCIDKVDKYSC